MLTKTQLNIMDIFTSRINKRFSINEIAKELKSPYPLIHRTMQLLLKENFIIKDDNGLLSLNYNKNQAELSYVEALRARKLIDKDKTIKLFVKEALDRIKTDFFVFLIFGSYVEKINPRDIDFLFIIDDEEKVEEIEKNLINIAGNYTKKFEFQVVSVKSAYEMLSKRDKSNILNETLNKHLILFGAENYYRMLKNAR